MTTLSQAQDEVNTYLVSNNRGALTAPVLNSIFTLIISALSTAIGHNRAVVHDADYGVGAGDSIVAYATLSAPRTVSLPQASSLSGSTVLVVVDESGNCAQNRTITVAPNGADTISGVGAPIVLRSGFAAVTLECNNMNGWVVVSRKSTRVLETMTGTADGSNSVFSLSASPQAGSLVAFVNGLVTSAFALSGSTVTFSSAPASGSAIVAYYDV